jgi:ATP-binding cassette, subfamily C, type I secretion system permease/ATPase
LRDCRRAFASVAVFSGIVNLLMLAGPLYMLQVYDRVLNSRSVPMLIALSIFLVDADAPR